jgi:hypothetical protein
MMNPRWQSAKLMHIFPCIVSCVFAGLHAISIVPATIWNDTISPSTHTHTHTQMITNGLFLIAVTWRVIHVLYLSGQSSQAGGLCPTISGCVRDFPLCHCIKDRLCGLVVRVLGYRSGGPVSIPGTTRKKSSGSGTGSTQPREYNWGATW